MVTATKQWAYRVVKSQRGSQGEWFRYGAAATFPTQTEAEEYASRFAAEQKGVAGTRILVVRNGGRTVAAFPVLD